jgi:hypothetical protein
MAHGLAVDPDDRRLRPQEAIGVDLHLDAAIAEDALGHDGDHVDAVNFRGDDKRRWLVVGIGRAGADRGYEGFARADDLAVPLT